MDKQKELQNNMNSSVERDDDPMFIKKSMQGSLPEKCMACDNPI